MKLDANYLNDLMNWYRVCNSLIDLNDLRYLSFDISLHPNLRLLFTQRKYKKEESLVDFRGCACSHCSDVDYYGFYI